MSLHVSSLRGRRSVRFPFQRVSSSKHCWSGRVRLHTQACGSRVIPFAARTTLCRLHRPDPHPRAGSPHPRIDKVPTSLPSIPSLPARRGPLRYFGRQGTRGNDFCRGVRLLLLEYKYRANPGGLPVWPCHRTGPLVTRATQKPLRRKTTTSSCVCPPRELGVRVSMRANLDKLQTISVGLRSANC